MIAHCLRTAGDFCFPPKPDKKMDLPGEGQVTYRKRFKENCCRKTALLIFA
nr:MAG TPA: hypothetical protein [Caudoviricetes sp.]